MPNDRVYRERIMTARQLARALGAPLAELMQDQPPVPALRLARYRSGLTVVDLFQRSGVSRRTIRLIQQGQRAPKLSTLSKLAAVLDVAVADLLEHDERSAAAARA
ncbi:MAG: helix-turn-helix domain-containing protein [Chloroflexi bacterium]|nr:helix-turn-helix domain-containing protein [Chloroflexota bacterium]